ncbi:iron export ABC transporter permease subunit FetB [soil metagenome]
MSYVDIAPWRLVVVFAMLLATSIFVSRRAGLGLEKELVIGAIRAAVQLLGVGYLLVVLFHHQRPEWVFLVLAVMLGVAGFTSARRVESGPPVRVLALRSLLAIVAGSTFALVPVFVFVVTPTPWFDAKYIIPISGIIVANAMNVVAQVNERIFATARADRAEIEQWLALGATPKQALKRPTQLALRAALIPTINGLVTVGLVALPGMMTGQIVSGIAPEHAVRYQIVIMYQLVIVAAVSGGLAAYLARRLLFNDRAQLIG